MILNVRRLLILAICVIFIASGAVNQGFSRFVLSLPFIFAFAYFLKGYSFRTKITSIVVVAAIIFPLAWQHSTNKIIYPWIGDEFIASCGWEAIKYQENYTGHSYETLKRKGSEVEEQYVISKRLIPCDALWELASVEVQHPNLTTVYYPVFSIAGHEVAMSGYEFNAAFESKLLKHNQISSSHDLQSKWTNNLSLLMMWPAIPVIVFSHISAIQNFVQ